jgi:hypothetical protein
VLPCQRALDRSPTSLVASADCRRGRHPVAATPGRNPIGYLFSVALAPTVTPSRLEMKMRSNRFKTYAASGLVLAALAAGSYGVVTLSSGKSVVTHTAPSATSRVVPPAVAPPTTATAPTPSTSAAPSHLTPSAPPVASTPPVAAPVSPPLVVHQQPPTTSGIPQGGGGDGDPDNSGAPSDGDGNV